MADVTNFNINGDNISVKDTVAREQISTLQTNKQNTITITDEKYLTLNENGQLNLDSSNFITIDDLNELKETESDNYESLNLKIKNLQEQTITVLNAITNNRVNSDFTYDSDILAIDSVNDLSTKVDSNTNSISNLTTTISSNKAEAETNLNNLSTKLTEKDNEFSDRLNWVEKEVFGSAYSDNTNISEDSNSRIDNLERLLNLVVGACLKRNILISEDASLKEYNSNSSNYDAKEINTTNYSYN